MHLIEIKRARWRAAGVLGRLSVCIWFLFSGLSLAQDSSSTATLPEPLTPAAIDALLSRLSDSEVRAILSEELHARAAPTAEQPELSPPASRSIAQVTREVAGALGQRAVAGPQNMVAAIGSIWAYMVSIGPTRSFQLALVLGLALFAGFAADRLFRRRAARGHTELTPSGTQPFPASFAIVSRRFLRETGGTILHFLVTALILVLALPERQTELGMTVAVWLVLLPRLGSAILRFFLSPNNPALRMVHADDWTASFLSRNLLGVFVAFGLGMTLAGLVEVIGVDPSLVQFGFWLNAFIFIWLAVIVVRARHGIRGLILGNEASHTPVELALARAYPVFAVTAIAVTWLAGVVVAAVGNPALLHDGRHFASLAIVLLVPMCDALIREAVRLLMRPMRGQGLAAERAYVSTHASYVRMVRVVVFGAILVFTAGLWGVTLFGVAKAGVGSAYAGKFVEALLILVVGYLVWEMTRLAFNRRLANERVEGIGETSEEGPRGGASSRLGTILPLASGTSQAVVAVLFGLTALSHVGVNVTALLAGAGVAGIAIGFGAQKLVADVVSGVFFLIDDAFRLNEYIDVGGTQGTVEKIALRSLALRQSDGPITCVPYSNVSGVTNFSRDWGIMKLKFTVPYNTDVERVRKIFKRIGTELVEDPRFKDAILEPFKSQGVREFSDAGIVVRGRFMFRPDLGVQFTIRREIFRRIQEEFTKAGIEFARREVRVSVDTAGAPLTDKALQTIAAAADQSIPQVLPADATKPPSS